MDWLNLHTSTLDDPALAAADDTHRSHWLHLMRYCIGQENNGRIRGAKTWNERKWLLLCRVPQASLADDGELWKWEGDDLVVSFYPKKKQKEVQDKREAGREGGLKSAATRAQKSSSTPSSSASSTPSSSAATERKGMEGEGKGREKEGNGVPDGPRPTDRASLLSYAESIGLSEIEAAKFSDHFESNGWMTGRNRVKSWQAAMRTWQRRAGEFSGNGSVSAPLNGGKNLADGGAPRTADPVIFG